LSRKKRKDNYSKVEDTCLVQAWADVSIDSWPGVTKQQSDIGSWKCICPHVWFW
jgi:hypothetical protein